MERVECDSKMGVDMIHGCDGSSDANPDPQLLVNVPAQTTRQALAWILFPTRKFPKPSQQALVRPPDDQYLAAVVPDDGSGHLAVWDRPPFSGYGQDILQPALIGLAAVLDGAGRTSRFLGCADGCSQVHEPLVEPSRTFHGHESFGQAPEVPLRSAFMEGCLYRKQSAQHPPDIAIHSGCRLFQGHAQDSASRVVADSRQGREVLPRVWDLSLESVYDLFGRFMEITGPRIISHIFPHFEDLGQRG
jgi:hypothetical protein